MTVRAASAIAAWLRERGRGIAVYAYSLCVTVGVCSTLTSCEVWQAVPTHFWKSIPTGRGAEIKWARWRAMDRPGPARRRRHWWRRIVISVGILIIVVYGGVALLIKLPSVLPSLALPKADASAPTGPIDGTWHVAKGSLAGLRCPGERARLYKRRGRPDQRCQRRLHHL